MMSFGIVLYRHYLIYLMLYLFVEKGLAKMKDDDIENLLESMKEEFILIYQTEQEKRKETAEKAAMTRLHTTVTKFNDAINEYKGKGKKLGYIFHKKLPVPGWIRMYLGCAVETRLDGEFLCVLYLFNFMLCIAKYVNRTQFNCIQTTT